MMASEAKSGILERLDQLYEFERQPVTEDKLQPGSYSAGVFSGEHIAGTEFVIGALFVSFGARAFDVLVGLLVGNLLVERERRTGTDKRTTFDPRERTSCDGP